MSISREVKKVCEEHDFIDPTILLTALTNGVDLRKVSLVYKWIVEFEDEAGDEPPDELEFEQLKELIKNEARYLPVSLSDSLNAQKTLMEYMHSKKKSVDVQTTSTGDSVQPLKPSEVRRFKRKFNAKC